MKIAIEINETERKKDGLAKVIVKVPDYNIETILALPFKGLYNFYNNSNEITLDFLFIASTAYIIDKTIPRKRAYDRWTREIEVDFPVSNVKLWKNALEDLTTTINFLTGDKWNISFSKRKETLFRMSDNVSVLTKKAEAVCSLSGGVDSLIGAINLIHSGKFDKVQLIGHYDSPGAKKAQNILFNAISKEYPNKAELLQVRVSNYYANKQKSNDANVFGKESTLRSRSLVFMALGIYVAHSYGENIPLFMPENGFIALNIPLTPSRGGSCSTRTMHPYFLKQLQRTLRSVGIHNKIENPLELKTKGECVKECLNRKLLTSVIDHTVSCSHGTRKQNWERRASNVKNCGYCVPCLIRRASLHTLNLDSSDLYGIDVCQGEIKYNDQKISSNDLRAVTHALLTYKDSSKIKEGIIGIAPTSNLDERVSVIKKGLNEIEKLFRQKATVDVLTSIGLKTK